MGAGSKTSIVDFFDKKELACVRDRALCVTGTTDVDGVDALPIVDITPDPLEQGFLFIADYLDTNVTVAGDLTLLIRNTEALGIRMKAILSVGDHCRADLYEDPNISINGTLLPNFNLERDSALTTSVAVYQRPTLNSNGTLLSETLVQPGGLVKEGIPEIVMESGEDYVVRLTNIGSATAVVSIRIQLHDEGAI